MSTNQLVPRLNLPLPAKLPARVLVSKPISGQCRIVGPLWGVPGRRINSGGTHPTGTPPASSLGDTPKWSYDNAKWSYRGPELGPMLRKMRAMARKAAQADEQL